MPGNKKSFNIGKWAFATKKPKKAITPKEKEELPPIVEEIKEAKELRKKRAPGRKNGLGKWLLPGKKPVKKAPEKKKAVLPEAKQALKKEAVKPVAVKEKEVKPVEKQVKEEYAIESNEVMVTVSIERKPEDFVWNYILHLPVYGVGTKVLLENLKNILIADQAIQPEKMLDPKFLETLRIRFSEKATKLIEKEVPSITEEDKRILVGLLLQEMLGLGRMEFLLNDPGIEEIVVNSSKEPLWVYHKKIGWLKTNVWVEDEKQIHNYASIIARRIGKQITFLAPLLDAHLITGDRVNATLFPISSQGNTITIRKFRRDPWTVTDFINNGTVNSKIMALVWMAMQYELNIVISGGTASGKTSLLNVCMPFIQPNHRIITMEETRELSLPPYLHWVPLTTREPNIEGKGEVSLYDLLVNSLRMRPDRMVLGEVRRAKEVEVLFEGMHTGHSAYTTVHANTALETILRLVNPPINVPINMLESVHLNLVMYRNRRTGQRRLFEVAEFIPEKREVEQRIRPNVLFRWNPATDTIVQREPPTRVWDELLLVTGAPDRELKKELLEKEMILNWMVKKNITGVHKVGKLMAEYYLNPERVLSLAKSNKGFE